MIDVLLINPPYTKKGGNIWKTVASCMPPHALAIIASCLEKGGYSVRILDTHAEHIAVDNLGDYLKGNFDEPRFVGLTGSSVTIHHAYEVVNICKKLWPNTKIIFGGYHASSKPEQVIRQPNVSFVVRGEGEITFCEIVAGKDKEHIWGITYLNEQNEIVNNPERPLVKDLDIFPMPAYHLLPIKKYFPAVGTYKKKPAISMVTSRGCPGKCTFCYQPYGTNLRWHSAQRIYDEVILLINNYSIKEICFYDDNFATSKQRISQLCDLLIKNHINISWSCFSRVDWANLELLKLMKKAGCHQVMFGVESGDQSILDGMKKQITLDRIRQAVKWTKEAGLNCRAAFLFGMPGETESTMNKTINFALELDPDIAQFNVVSPNPGTELYEWAEKNGYIRTENWAEYDWASPILVLPTVSQGKVLEYYKMAYKKFYFRPKYIIRRISKIRAWADIESIFSGLKGIFDVSSH